MEELKKDLVGVISKHNLDKITGIKSDRIAVFLIKKMNLSRVIQLRKESELFNMLNHLVEHDCINDHSLVKECEEILSKVKGGSWLL